MGVRRAADARARHQLRPYRRNSPGRASSARGRFDFGWLWTGTMDVLAAAGLRIVLGTPTATASKWLMEARPDIAPVDARGRTLGFGSRRYHSFSSRAWHVESARIVGAVARRYGDHASLVAWQTDDEYGCHGRPRSRRPPRRRTPAPARRPDLPSTRLWPHKQDSRVEAGLIQPSDPDRRPRPRHQRHPRSRRRARCLGEHSAPQDPQKQFCLLQLGLPPKEPGRTLLQPDQAIPRSCHTLRSQAGELPRRAQARRNPCLACRNLVHTLGPHAWAARAAARRSCRRPVRPQRLGERMA